MWFYSIICSTALASIKVEMGGRIAFALMKVKLKNISNTLK